MLDNYDFTTPVTVTETKEEKGLFTDKRNLFGMGNFY
jgi:hypothetical protein